MTRDSWLELLSRSLDRVTLSFAPQWTLRRQRARIASELLARHYEAASMGRRTQGWRRGGGDANATTFSGASRIREAARDLVRNNPYAGSAMRTICDHVVGWGIVGKVAKDAGLAKAPTNVATDRWRRWAETTACDADGRNDFYGLQKLVVRSVGESGEVLVRRRWRRPEDELPIPMQLQVLEADYLDTMKDGIALPNGGRILQGVELDAIGRRAAYWLFRSHPGAAIGGTSSFQSERIPASEILHIYRQDRPGQVRGMSWFAPVLLRMKDFDDYEDAALMKQKIAACLAVITTDVDGTNPNLGTPGTTATNTGEPAVDVLEPGSILNVPPGRAINVVNPPTVDEHSEYAETVLRAIATGIGVTYEDLTGDYTELPFSAARMSRLRHWSSVYDWQWRIVIPQFCDPAWAWAMEAAVLAGPGLYERPRAEWTPPPMPMIDPQKEGDATSRLIRNGLLTWPEAIRERGYDPETQLKEIAEWNGKLDAAGVILDCDARKTSQQGQPTDTDKDEPAPSSAPAKTKQPASASNGNGRHA